MCSPNRLATLLAIPLLFPALAQATPLEQVADSLRARYSGTVREMGAQLEIQVRPAALGPNPIGHQLVETSEGIKRVITVASGIADLPGVDADGLSLFLCHEIGHVLGGAPFFATGDSAFFNPILNNVPPAKLISVEGQADYFATTSCLRGELEQRPAPAGQEDWLPGEKEFAEEKCQADPICLRGMKAVRQFITLIETASEMRKGPDSGGEEEPISIASTSDAEAISVSRSPLYYPSPECRVQTLVNGLLRMPRPACWYVE